MNIADKNAFYSEAARVLKPGARFVMYDLILGDRDVEVKYPTPWSRTPDESHLVSERQMLTALTESGFTIEATRDDTLEARQFLVETVKQIQETGLPTLSLATVLGQVMHQIIPNFLHNIRSKGLRLIAVSAIKQ